VVLPDSEFALGDSVRLRPDLAVLLSERWAKVDRKKTPIPLAPDIAIEVLSPSELADNSLRKVWIYLGAGVQEVWQVSPTAQRILIYCSDSSIRVVGIADRLTTPWLPGWELAVREIFER
jgi:Uma2 family endonuclease